MQQLLNTEASNLETYVSARLDASLLDHVFYELESPTLRVLLVCHLASSIDDVLRATPKGYSSSTLNTSCTSLQYSRYQNI